MDRKPTEGDVIELPVLGVQTAFVTSCERLRDILVDEYGHWMTLYETPGLVRPSPGEVRVAVRRTKVRIETEVRYEIRLRGRTVIEVEGVGARGSTDTDRLRSTLEIDDALLERPRQLIDEIIEPLVLFLIGAQDRVPIHAAAVVRDETGIVIAAPSGTGKSTLVYAAARRGYAPLADDPVYVQVEPELRVWGRRSRVHLRPDVREYFPELAGTPAVRLPTGKTKLVLEPSGSRRHVERVGLCCLRRDGSPGPRLTKISPSEAIAEVVARLEPGFDLFRDVLDDRILRLAAHGAWLLHLGSSPLEAVPLLDEVARAIQHDG